MKKITIDPFDPVSVSKAILEMYKFKDWLKEKVDELTERLAKDYALKTVAVDYGYTEGGSIVCTAEEIPNGWVVKAEGKGVCFIEYGTGDPAERAILFGEVPVPVGPGTWSAGHAGTYQDWVDGGKAEPYQYEHEPRSGMYYAFRAANDNVRKVAEEVFRT